MIHNVKSYWRSTSLGKARIARGFSQACSDLFHHPKGGGVLYSDITGQVSTRVKEAYAHV